MSEWQSVFFFVTSARALLIGRILFGAIRLFIAEMSLFSCAEW